MLRLLIILLLALGVGLAVVFALSALGAASRRGEATGRALARVSTSQKVAYGALLLLLLGVGAGLLEGL